MAGFRLRRAIRTLNEGGVIAYPTEAVYGLGCDPLDLDAVLRLLEIKGRAIEKGLILIAADQSQLAPFIETPTRDVEQQLRASWPGPVTWILPTRGETPYWLRGRHTGLAVRVTAHPLAAELCRAFGGPIVSTSANVAGRPAARTALQAQLRCPGVDHIVHGRTSGLARPSEIRDASTDATLRAG